MQTWILILIISAGGLQTKTVAINSTEFNSEKTCTIAKLKVLSSDINDKIYTEAICVPK